MSTTGRRKRRLLVAGAFASLAVVLGLGGKWLFRPDAVPVVEPVVTAEARVIPADVGFAIVKTGNMHVREGFVFEGGDYGKVLENDFSAFLVKHGAEYFLFDAGLGRHIDTQYEADMPRWQRLSFRYEPPVTPARDQLERTGAFPIARIFLSHSHWDHAAAIEDFPEAEVWVPAEELDALRRPRAEGGAWPSQVGSPAIRWHAYDFPGPPYEGFERSRDVYGDGRVVLVPLFGHTPGSVGLFLTVDSGRRFFFCGDAAWNAAAIPGARPRTSLARRIVDRDPDAAHRVLDHLRTLQSRHPELTIIPAHDGAVQRSLGFFPAWVR